MQRPAASVCPRDRATHHEAQSILKHSSSSRGTSLPIAIIGVGLRLPGRICTLEELAARLFAGADLITRVPDSRFATGSFEFPGAKGHAATFAAGIIEDVFDFDYRYFSLPRLEAQSMDPQQRLCLEMAVDAVNMANLPQSALAGTPTGVFIGSSSPDMAMSHADDVASITPYGMVGTNLAIISNRVSYCLDLRGPSMTIDTACSSSLTALAQAVGYLRAHPGRLCLAGGVNILLSPIPFIGFSQAHMLAEDGRCRVFDAAGSGYVRSEGGALLLLKTLPQAEADGDPVLAVIDEVLLNQDGRTPGISMPSGASQEQLLHELYDGRDLSALAYVEAHGTGTRAGDPVEASSIGRVLGTRLLEEQHRRLCIGSVKSNLGHLETASGMAGILKALVVLRHRAIPPNIHLDNPNPAIDFAGLGLEVVRQTTPLPATAAAPLIGVNSFGFGGANGHALLSGYTPAPPPPAATAGAVAAAAADGRPAEPAAAAAQAAADARPAGLTAELTAGLAAGRLLRLSAASPAALQALAADCRALATASNYTSLAANLAFCRDPLGCELYLRADDWPTLQGELSGCDAAASEDYVSAVRHRGRGSLVFSGNGSQFAGMGRALLECEPLFARLVERIDAALGEFQSWSVGEYMRRGDEEWQLQDTEKIQVLIFTVQTALAAFLALHGVEAPSACGHSVGEVAAAHYCGLLSLRDACRVIVCRSRHQAATYRSGDMAVVRMERAALQALLHGRFSDLEIASTNTAGSFTLSGGHDSLQAFVETARRQFGAAAKLLNLNYPFHSRRMEPIRERLLRDLEAVQPQPAVRDFYSCAGAPVLRGQTLDPGYWWRNIREEVRFESSILRQAADGHDLFVEIGPRDILLHYIREIAREHRQTLHTLALTARFSRPHDFRRSLYALLSSGLCVHPERICEREAVRRSLQLPRYRFDRERCEVPRTREYLAYFRQHSQELLGRRLPYAGCAYAGELDTRRLPWLLGHEVQGRCLLPMAAFISMALTLLRQAEPQAGCAALEDFTILAPIEVSAEHITITHAELDAQGQFTLSARRHLGGEELSLRARGMRGTQGALPACDRDALQAVRLHGRSLSCEELYARAHACGIDYSGPFRSLRGIRRLGPRLLLRLENRDPAPATGVAVAALDGALQALFALTGESAAAALQLPSGVDQVMLSCARPPGGGELNALVEVRSATPLGSVLDVWVLDSYDQPQLVLRGVRYLRFGSAAQLHGFFAQTLRPGPGLRPLGTVAWEQALAGVWERCGGQVPQVSQELRSYCTALICVCILQAVQLRGQAAFADELFGVVFADARAEEQGRYLLDILVANALAEDCGEGRYSVEDASDLDADKIFNTIITLYPGSFVQAELIARLGTHIRPLLSGHLSFEHCLGQGQDCLFEHYCSHSPDSLMVSRLCAAFLQAAASARGRQVPRVLLLGGANRTLLAALDPLVRGLQIELTIFSPHEDLQLRSRYAAQDNVHLLSGLTAPGAEHGGFDILLAADPLHCAMHLRGHHEALAAALRPGGYALGWEYAAGFADVFINSFRDYELPAAEELHAGTAAGCLGTFLMHQAPDLSTCLTHELSCGLFYLCRRGGAEAPLTPPPLTQRGAFIDLGAGLGLGSAAALWQLLHEHDGGGLLAAVEARALLEELRSSPGLRWPHARTLVALCSLQAGDGAAALAGLCQGLSQLLQALTAAGAGQICVLLDDAGAVLDADEAGAADARARLAYALLAMLRTLRSELGCDLRVIALDAADPAARAALAAELACGGTENEVCLRGTRRLLPTFMTTAPAAATAAAMPAAADGAAAAPAAAAPAAAAAGTWDEDGPVAYEHLECPQPGTLTALRFVPGTFAPPGEEEVIVRVTAAGLNYRDVMWALGLLPAEALERGFSGPHLGLECTGTVVQTGARVSHVRPGQRVIAFASACLATCVRCPAHAVFALPAQLSLIQGAALPVAFLTAYYSLIHLARAVRGERVLIHGAAGGVGFAAVEIAQHQGLEIYATAGTPHKRSLLHRLGVSHVYDSRSLDFAAQIMADTRGRGVDVVLNSLYREGAQASLRLLAPFGRFIELGKRDIFENNALRLKLFKDNLSFYGVDVDELLVYRRELAAALFGDILRHFEQGDYFPLPVSVFPRSQCQEAFATMKSSAHIGKIVITMEDEDRPPQPAPLRLTLPQPLPALQAGAGTAALITGGLGGIGTALTQQLLEQGCSAVCLLGRRALHDGQVAAALERLRAAAEARGAGQQVLYHAADVAQPSQVEAALSALQRQLAAAGLKLTLFVHAAVALRDGYARELSAEDYALLIATKYGGACNVLQGLERRRLSPAHCVLLSSVTTVLGNEGQANYVFANALLEGLARAPAPAGSRVCALLPGPVADAGLLQGRTRLLELFEQRMGLGALSSREVAAAALECAAAGENLALCSFSLRTLGTLRGLDQSRFSLLRAHYQLAARAQDQSLLESIMSAEPQQAVTLLSERLQTLFAVQLGTTPEQIGVEQSLAELGVDSLSLMEIVTTLEGELQIRTPAGQVSGNSTIAQIARSCISILRGGGDVEEEIISALERQHGVSLSDDFRGRLLPGREA